MEADIHTLFESDFYCIRDFKCRCTDGHKSAPEYSESFCISFVRKGNFLFNVFRHSLDSYTGCVLITKPGYERTVTHVHTVPDECTIFDFKTGFFNELVQLRATNRFFQNIDLHSTLVKIHPETEYLHFRIMRLIASSTGSRLEIDILVMELIETVFGKISDYKPDFDVGYRMKKHHLTTIETAKGYIASRFMDDLSLRELAEHCCLSPFQFSRIFKALTSWTPHQFLLNVRLKNSEILLKNTTLPIADIAFSSGFNSIEHFTEAFRKKYQCPPARFRTEKHASIYSWE